MEQDEIDVSFCCMMKYLICSPCYIISCFVNVTISACQSVGRCVKKSCKKKPLSEEAIKKMMLQAEQEVAQAKKVNAIEIKHSTQIKINSGLESQSNPLFKGHKRAVPITSNFLINNTDKNANERELKDTESSDRHINKNAKLKHDLGDPATHKASDDVLNALGQNAYQDDIKVFDF